MGEALCQKADMRQQHSFLYKSHHLQPMSKRNRRVERDHGPERPK